MPPRTTVAWLGHTAPIVRLALAYSSGAALGLVGAPLWTAPLLFTAATLSPLSAGDSPVCRGRSRFGGVALGIVVVAGFLVSAGSHPGEAPCPTRVSLGSTAITGRFLVSPRTGSAPFRRADGCGEVTVVLPRQDAAPASRESGTTAGRLVRVEGVWRDGRRRPWFMAGRVLPVADQQVDRPLAAVRWGVVRWRDGLLKRLSRLYGDRAPLVAALTLARREGLDPEVREAFAVTGVAHLLAISGFHVGVVAGLALAVLRACRVSRRAAVPGAAALAWSYVALLGFPDAACRAALILACSSLAHARGRPASRWAALSSAALVLVVLDPTRLASPGFQLSFAGAAGLVTWSRPLAEHVGGLVERRTGLRPPRSLTTALSAGVAATLATIPIAAWHFERVSLVGIPVTLLVSPLVSVALPGAIASVAVDFVSSPAAHFLAGGVSLVLDALVVLTGQISALPGASRWVDRTTVVAGLAGVCIASMVSRRPGVDGRTRRMLVGLYAATAVVSWPLLAGLQRRGSLEVLMIDVGQGDAIAIRSPRGRWMLVDAGPPASDPSRLPPVVRALRRRGVDRLETVLLTHADADHYGGAGAVLDAFRVGRVVDPALPVAKGGYLAVTAEAERRGIPWIPARAGGTLDFDGVQITILHPPDSVIAQEMLVAPGQREANEGSVVLMVRWNGFSAVLTGDA